MKKSRVFGACLFVFSILLSGCGDYSLQKAPTTDIKTIPISNTDAKLLISNKVNSVLSSQTSSDTQLLVYLENTVNPTTEMKESLKNSITMSEDLANKTKSEIQALQVSTDMKNKQDNAVDLLSKLSTELQNLLIHLDKNDFNKLKQSQINYKNIISSLGAVVFQ